MSDRSQMSLMVGLPATGKTTYLAAAYHVSEEGDVPSALRIAWLVGDRTYIDDLRDRWVRCEEAKRTPAGQEEEVVLVFEPNGDSLELIVPDLSGESFASYWTDRSWSEAFDAQVKKSTGLLLFLNPNELTERQLIEDADLVIAALEVDNQGGLQRSSTDRGERQTHQPAWNPVNAPDQVKLVDILQFIDVRRHDVAALPIAVIVSAWDVMSSSDDPETWLRRRTPLLAQYLDANSGRYPHRVFGVSAQGGDIKTDRDRLLALAPSKRINVVGDGVTTSTTSQLQFDGCCP